MALVCWTPPLPPGGSAIRARAACPGPANRPCCLRSRSAPDSPTSPGRPGATAMPVRSTCAWTRRPRAGCRAGHRGCPEMRGYFQLREERRPDAYLLALAVDALPPVIFGIARAGWSPTVELTWHMRGLPAPGLLRVAARSRHVSGGWFDEESEVWDSAGCLVAQSRQIARVGRGPGGPAA